MQKHYLEFSQVEKKGNGMEKLIVPQNTIAVLQKYQIRFQKKYGQNFLIDQHVLDKIIFAANITKEDIVLEIGPGIGTLTQELCERAGRVIAIEIDPYLAQIAQETVADYKNGQIIQADAMKLDLQRLLEKEDKDRTLKVVANLPYYITTPLLFRLLESDLPIQSITVMVQKEVAQRIQAKPGTKAYGALSLAIQYRTDPYIAAYVPENCFIPRPKVGSAVIHLKQKQGVSCEKEMETIFFALVKAGFQQRRKMFLNCLSYGDDVAVTKEQLECILKELGISSHVRAEQLSLEQFLAIAKLLLQQNK